MGGAAFVHPYDDAAVLAGQGTIGLELAEELPQLDAVLVPVSGGGMVGGIAVALHALRPGVRVIAVEPKGKGLGRCLALSQRVLDPEAANGALDTIADAIRTKCLGPTPWAAAPTCRRASSNPSRTCTHRRPTRCPAARRKPSNHTHTACRLSWWMSVCWSSQCSSWSPWPAPPQRASLWGQGRAHVFVRASAMGCAAQVLSMLPRSSAPQRRLQWLLVLITAGGRALCCCAAAQVGAAPNLVKGVTARRSCNARRHSSDKCAGRGRVLVCTRTYPTPARPASEDTLAQPLSFWRQITARFRFSRVVRTF